MLILDVSLAQWYPKTTRDVYLKLPAEDPRVVDLTVCGKLRRTMYGTVDAAQRWADHYIEILVPADFLKVTASPCHF